MEISRHWRLRKPRYGLVGEKCPHCETKIFPPRDLCPECGLAIQAISTLLADKTNFRVRPKKYMGSSD